LTGSPVDLPGNKVLVLSDRRSATVRQRRGDAPPAVIYALRRPTQRFVFDEESIESVLDATDTTAACLLWGPMLTTVFLVGRPSHFSRGFYPRSTIIAVTFILFWKSLFTIRNGNKIGYKNKTVEIL